MKNTFTFENSVRWLLSYNKNEKKITVTCQGESRIYDILEDVSEINQEDEYVLVYVGDGKKMYQFKFEYGSFLVGDIYIDGDFIETFATYVFGEE